jgi:hypothetical protein
VDPWWVRPPSKSTNPTSSGLMMMRDHNSSRAISSSEADRRLARLPIAGTVVAGMAGRGEPQGVPVAVNQQRVGVTGGTTTAHANQHVSSAGPPTKGHQACVT